MSVEELIGIAIRTCHRLSFIYRGLPRIVNPERLGRSTTGVMRLRAVQVGGESASGRYGGSAPKLFDVDLMSEVTVLDGVFRIPRQYQRGDDAFTHIDIELDPAVTRASGAS
ncbi:MAG TPA: hypothetical protein VGJ28_17270 [Micromonosporaceae bacterium]|jgi:hypothetical protein